MSNRDAVNPARIGAALRAARKRSGMTQAQAFAESGIARPIVARAEAGRHSHSLDTLERLATAYGVTVWSLLAVGGDVA